LNSSILCSGREKHPAYNLSAFFHGSSLFGIFKQEMAHAIGLSDDSTSGSLVFQCELTSRDREHIREPPKDGLFIFGLYLWGYSSDKNAVEHGVVDAPAKSRDSCSSMPVLHVTCVSAEKAAQSASQQQSGGDMTTGSRMSAIDTYPCPVFPKRSGDRRPTDVICELDLWKKANTTGGQISRWAWRGVCMTIKPY
jgi:dynein heavy chain, axonemal